MEPLKYGKFVCGDVIISMISEVGDPVPTVFKTHFHRKVVLSWSKLTGTLYLHKKPLLSLTAFIYYSLSLPQVQRRYSQGDYAGAQKASKLAYKWGSAAVMFGIAFMVIFVVLKLYLEDRHIRQYYYWPASTV